MSNRPSLDDYVDVAERIQDFKDAHPDGSLQTLGWEVVTVADRTFIVYRAAAYRTDADCRPGHGIAWEPFPGRTPYTKDSELMNAETAAWGRAIVALGLVANRKLASRQEVRNRQAEQESDAADVHDGTINHAASAEHNAGAVVTDAEVVPDEPMAELINATSLDTLRKSFVESGKTHDDLAWCLLSVGVTSLPANPSKRDIGDAMRGLTVEQALRLDSLLKGEDDAVPGSGETA